MSHYSATYSPDDNKLRLYSISRLPAEDYARVKAAGFSWAPKQEVFVAPMWTPAREDLLIEMCGEIDDEDSSLLDRAEVRADRFENYSDKRESEAARARKAVAGIADNIPFCQPILVGHHSEKRARKDAERIENGMRKAIRLFETSAYWERRAAAALAHAKYKELPGVRQRRIKGLEADLRKAEREISNAQKMLALWSIEGLSLENAKRIANSDMGFYCFTLADYPREAAASQYEGQIGLWSALDGGIITAVQAAALAKPRKLATIAHYTRWVAHYQNRLTYERAMLAEQGGGAADKFDIQPGGQVLLGRDGWAVVLRVNRAAGRISSVRTNAKYVPVRCISEVQDYRAPIAEVAEAVKAATKLAPLVNYPGDGFHHMTAEEWAKISKSEWCFNAKVAAQGLVGAHRQRSAPRFALMRDESSARYERLGVFLTDSKVVMPPALDSAPKAAPLPRAEYCNPASRSDRPPARESEIATQALKQRLAAGVQVVSAPQLFPTPPEIAERVAELAAVPDGAEFLEPSAGTGNLVQAVLATSRTARAYIVEVSHDLSRILANQWGTRGHKLVRGDFLEVAPHLGAFDRIVMNPPFANGADIEHIHTAARLLNPGGRLVAICANGPRQQRELKPLAAHWEDLPAGSFAESGTMVNAALLVIQR